MLKHVCPATLAVLLPAAAAFAVDWDALPYTRHSTYQAVNADGSRAYAGGSPVRMVGVVINDTEDWLDPTPAYSGTYQAFQMGGEAELYVQALWTSTQAALGTEYYDPADFGGTACWMGQNYGNLPFKGDAQFSYTDAEWTAELGRLNLYGGDGVTDPIRAGDLVEIRARAGLHYKGKMNVNEQHDNDYDRLNDWDQQGSPGDGQNHDFELVRVAKGFGLPAPLPVTLSALKNPDDTPVFDPNRQTGGERYQSTLVQLQDVWTASAASWAADSDLEVTDGTRTFNVHLGRNGGFDGTALFASGQPFHVTGILDQAASDGTYSTDGYQLLAMDAAGFTAVPEPTGLAWMAFGAVLLRRRRRR
jgi:hypothetical protein